MGAHVSYFKYRKSTFTRNRAWLMGWLMGRIDKVFRRVLSL